MQLQLLLSCMLPCIVAYAVSATTAHPSSEQASNTTVSGYHCSDSWSRWMAIPRSMHDTFRDHVCPDYRLSATCSDRHFKCYRRRSCTCDLKSNGRFIADTNESCTQLANCLWPVCCVSVTGEELHRVPGAVVRIEKLQDLHNKVANVSYMNLVYVPYKRIREVGGASTPIWSGISANVDKEGSLMNAYIGILYTLLMVSSLTLTVLVGVYWLCKMCRSSSHPSLHELRNFDFPA